MASSAQVSQPPQPPQLERKLRFHLTQLVGVPLLALLPVLAVVGIFGVGRGEAQAEDGALALRVSYPERFRLKMIEPLEIYVRNAGDAPLAVVVRLDTNYLTAFSNVEITPGPTLVSDEVYEVSLGEVQPGETRLVSVELQAERYWQHRGSVSATSDAGDRAELAFGTFVIP